MILGGRSITEGEGYDKYLRDHMIIGFWVKFPELCKLTGLTRDFGFRIMTKQHEPWWKEDTSPWKHQLYHKPLKPDLSSNWVIDRVLGLLECDVTHTYLGESFSSLMQLDYQTFCDIEEVVNRMSAKIAESAENATKPKK